MAFIGAQQGEDGLGAGHTTGRVVAAAALVRKTRGAGRGWSGRDQVAGSLCRGREQGNRGAGVREVRVRVFKRELKEV